MTPQNLLDISASRRYICTCPSNPPGVLSAEVAPSRRNSLSAGEGHFFARLMQRGEIMSEDTEKVEWSSWMEAKIQELPVARGYIRALIEAAYQTGRADNAVEMEE